ncbi:ammonium transporter [Aetokthonos hydrillicola]|uniref:ammonium transporter n=1 Tax=Aetokthonos hydrillicola TaxID=1550245 RepID=UPI001ABA7237
MDNNRNRRKSLLFKVVNSLATKSLVYLNIIRNLVIGFWEFFQQARSTSLKKGFFRLKSQRKTGLRKLPMSVEQGGQVNKLARLGKRLRDKEWRRYAYLLLLGKGMALMILFAAFTLISTVAGTPVLAADPVLKGNDIVNPINTLWTLLAAFLVFAMQVGFTMLEAGFCRSRETVNVLMECIVDTCLCGLLFYAWGFAFMFSHGNGFIGLNWFFLQGAPATYESTGVAFLAYWLFQFAFADTCSTITSGAMIGRTGFIGDLLYSIGVSGFIYPIIGHCSAIFYG